MFIHMIIYMIPQFERINRGDMLAELEPTEPKTVFPEGG